MSRYDLTDFEWRVIEPLLAAIVQFGPAWSAARSMLENEKMVASLRPSAEPAVVKDVLHFPEFRP